MLITKNNSFKLNLKDLEKIQEVIYQTVYITKTKRIPISLRT